jgi:ArsR family transcriptional regulator, lead/cadmium/zinc/bismuth-responsive transcriptional repressor
MTKDDCEEYCIHPDVVARAKAQKLDDDTIGKLSDIYKIICEPIRIKIINALSTGEMCVCDLSSVLELDHSAVSHQLRMLRDKRIVNLRKDGKMAYYSLCDEHVLSLFREGLKHTRE